MTQKFQIRSAMRSHLLDMDGLPDINWENQIFTPSVDEDGNSLPYIRETLLPANESLTANNERTGIGIYQLDLFVPVGYSIATAENLADSIKNHFRPAQTVGSVILERAAVGQGQNFGAGQDVSPWYFIPIFVDYRVHQTNT